MGGTRRCALGHRLLRYLQIGSAGRRLLAGDHDIRNPQHFRRDTGAPSSAPETSVTAQPSATTQATVPPPPAPAAPAPASPLPTGAQITYSVTGTKAPFDQITITYTDASGVRRSPAQPVHSVDDHRHTDLDVRGRLDRSVQLAAVEQAQLLDHPQRWHRDLV